jgi:hypothetical protein
MEKRAEGKRRRGEEGKILFFPLFPSSPLLLCVEL